MNSFALLMEDVYAEHKTAPGHPESPSRVHAVHKALEEFSGKTLRISPREAEFEELCLCHDPAYVESVLREIEEGAEELAGGDVSVGAKSGFVARLAVGGVLNAVDAVIAGQAATAFCAVRPPGHHARPTAAMGFCLFGNVAIAARHAITQRGLERVAIVDWDVHHGNGTQEILYSDPSTLFFSTHQWPWYPGSGLEEERGEARGEGLTINRPLPAGSGKREVLGAFREAWLPAVTEFQPELILISAGFDSRAGDPLGQFRLRDEDFAELTRMICDAAGESCHGRVVSVLEGGYALDGLASAVKAHCLELSGMGSDA